jgi:hypothetical protein
MTAMPAPVTTDGSPAWAAEDAEDAARDVLSQRVDLGDGHLIKSVKISEGDHKRINLTKTAEGAIEISP